MLIVITSLLIACKTDLQKPIDMNTEHTSIEKAIRGTIEWAKDKDFNKLYSIIANDSNYIEVHPENRIVKGIDEFTQMERFWASSDFKHIGYEISDLKIIISESGDVAWYYCMLDDINEWKGKPASWINTRWTGVLEKREGKWRVVQMHFSNATDNNN